MRIAVAAHRSAYGGGVERYLATLVPALSAAGHDVACWFETGTPGEGSESWNGAVSWTAEDQPQVAMKAVTDWRPDVLFIHGLSSPARERELMTLGPSVCFAHSYYGTCVSGSKMHRSPSQHCCTRRFGAACLAQYYPRRCGGWNPLTLLRHYELQRSRLALLDDYTRVVVASRHMASEYARHGLLAKTRVVSLPIESSARPASRGAASNGVRLLYLGRLEETKGAHIAIDSAAIVASATGRRTELQMSGEGSWYEPLRERAARAMSHNAQLTVRFTGWLQGEECVDSFDRADLLLVPSCWPEPFGMVGMEAARRGLPAVAFAVGGIPEWLMDGVNGKLVSAEPPDSRRFAEAIIDCLADPVELGRMRERSTSCAQRFSIETHISEVDAVLQEAVESHHSRSGR